LKRLLLLRHAKSSWRENDLDDHDRPLAKRGLTDAPRMGERLRLRGVAPGLILSSTAVRARATAEAVASSLKVGATRFALEADLYLATPGEILHVLSRQSDELDELMLVGHNPGMTGLVNMLLPSLRLSNLPTCGVVAVDFDIESWSELTACGPILAYYDYPKNPLPAISPD